MRGPYSTPITPLTGSLFHADPHLLEPKSRETRLSGGLIKTESELEAWLDQARERLKADLALGPVIPRI